MEKTIIAKYIRNHKVIFEQVTCEVISTQTYSMLALCHETNQYGTLFLNWYGQYIFVPHMQDE
jgi:hypothetical protein